MAFIPAAPEPPAPVIPAQQYMDPQAQIEAVNAVVDNWRQQLVVLQGRLERMEKERLALQEKYENMRGSLVIRLLEADGGWVVGLTALTVTAFVAGGLTATALLRRR